MKIYPGLEFEIILIDAILNARASTFTERWDIYIRARESLYRQFEHRILGEVFHVFENLELAIEIVESAFEQHELWSDDTVEPHRDQLIRRFREWVSKQELPEQKRPVSTETGKEAIGPEKTLKKS